MYCKAINNEKGVALILIAVSIVVLFGFGALAIDVGHLYNVKSQLQAAADAAALAGASEMGSGTYATMNTNAFNAADRIASRNYADVSSTTGHPLPVKLDSGDVVLGKWSGDTFTPSNTPAEINAVKVYANRMKNDPASNQPKVNNWFAKVFSLLPLGTKFDFSAIQAYAIAAKEGNPLPVVPIAVDEYWSEPSGPYGADQVYPNSFVRQYKVTAPGVPQNTAGNISKMFKNTFALLGADAQPNGSGSKDPNSYVNLDYRTDIYTGNIGYQAKDVTDTSCSNCINGFDNLGAIDKVNHGGIQNDKNSSGIDYLTKKDANGNIIGYPPTRILPTALYENLNPFYPANQSSTYTTNSFCPYATVFYFSGGGKEPINKINTDYPPGKRFMALVYDNTHTGGKTEQDTKLVTVVGYVPIEVDGYGGALGAGDLKSYTADPTYLSNKPTSYPGGTSTVLGTDGNTMYGHALDDIIQPSPPGGGCDFMQNLRAAAAKYGKATVRLVGPNEHIGMAANH